MRLSGMGRASELLLLPIRGLYEWTFPLVLAMFMQENTRPDTKSKD
jgi:hypothetical protein